MRPIRLHKTSTFRLALSAAVLFALSGCLVLGFVYFHMLRRIDLQLAGALARESADLSAMQARSGLAGLTEAVTYRMSDRRGAVRLYLVADGGGRVVAGNLAAWPAQAPPPGGGPRDVQLGEGGHVDARVQVLAFADGTRLLVGRDLGERDSVRLTLEESLAGGLALMLALGVVVGLAMARHALIRLEAVNRTADTILGGDLGGRVPLAGSGDEYDHLAETINAMLERIQRLVATVRTVTHNVAHDLRSPLNRLRSRLEVAALSTRSAEEYQEAIRRAIAEADAIIATFNAMLRIARIAGRGEARPTGHLDPAELVESIVDFYQPLAEEKDLGLTVQADPGLSVVGDPELLSQALINLIDNAVKYTPAGGTIAVSALAEGPLVRLVVADSGPGIPADKRGEVLQHFTRLDTSRHTPGTGLGLSLVASVADYHGAQLALEDNHPGLKVTLTLHG